MKPTDKKFEAAVAHYQAGRMDAAAAICKKILIGHHKNIDALRMQGSIALRAGRAGPAINYLTKATRESGDDAQVLTELGFAFLELN